MVVRIDLSQRDEAPEVEEVPFAPQNSLYAPEFLTPDSDADRPLTTDELSTPQNYLHEIASEEEQHVAVQGNANETAGTNFGDGDLDDGVVDIDLSQDSDVPEPHVALLAQQTGSFAPEFSIAGTDADRPLTADEVLEQQSHDLEIASGTDQQGAVDGDVNDVFANDVTTSFAVAAVPVDIKIDDVLVPQDVPLMQEVTVPVTFTSAGGVRSIVFTVDYDPTLMTLTGVKPDAGLPDGAEVGFQISLLKDGYANARISFASSIVLPPGAINLVRLEGSVPEAASRGGERWLRVAVMTINGEAAQTASNDAVKAVGNFTDVDADGLIDGVDIALVRQRVETGFSAFRVVDPTLSTSRSTPSFDETIGLPSFIGGTTSPWNGNLEPEQGAFAPDANANIDPLKRFKNLGGASQDTNFVLFSTIHGSDFQYPLGGGKVKGPPIGDVPTGNIPHHLRNIDPHSDALR